MLTVDFRRFPVRPGHRVLDLGCGGGRHAFELYRRGADVVAFDLDPAELAPVTGMFGAMRAAGEAGQAAGATAISGDATAMPFGDGMFDRVIAAEVLEHIGDDQRAMNELARVLRPGGLAAITVPSFLPERVCWALSTEYHEVPGGHVRIYTRVELQAKLARAGLTALWHHHAHGLHSPYWWLKCAVGVHNDKHRLTSAKLSSPVTRYSCKTPVATYAAWWLSAAGSVTTPATVDRGQEPSARWFSRSHR